MHCFDFEIPASSVFRQEVKKQEIIRRLSGIVQMLTSR